MKMRQRKRCGNRALGLILLIRRLVRDYVASYPVNEWIPPWLNWPPPEPLHVFNVGDLASRGCDDVQRVVDVYGNCAEFECIKAPASGWCAVGDREWNLTRRYQPVAAP